MLDRQRFQQATLRVRRLILREHFVNRRIADRMSSHPPSSRFNSFTISVYRSAAISRNPRNVPSSHKARVRLPHQSAFKPAVHDQLHPADPEPFIPFIRLHAGAR